MAGPTPADEARQREFDEYRPYAGFQQSTALEEARAAATPWRAIGAACVLGGMIYVGVHMLRGEWNPPLLPFIAAVAGGAVAMTVAHWQVAQATRACPRCRRPLNHYDHPIELLLVHYCADCRLYFEEKLEKRRDS